MRFSFVLGGCLLAGLLSPPGALGQPGPHGDPAIRISDDTVQEPDGDGKRIAVFFVRLPNSAGEQRVRVETKDATARSGTDYRKVHSTLVFQPGETRRRVRVAIRGDGVEEKKETFFVMVRNLSGTTALSVNRGVGTIRDND